MKKTLLLLATAATIFSCSKDDDEIVPDNSTIYETLTFEDADYLGSGNYLGYTDWSSLIDEEYYGAPLIYGESDADSWSYNTTYNWYDEGNTELASQMLSGGFSAGGHAISNYTLDELTADPYYSNQLSVVSSGNGGYASSENFAVHFGYDEDADYDSNPDLPNFYFKDGVERVVDHMYVKPTNLALYFYQNGDDYTSVSSDDYVVLTAAGYDSTGALTGTVSIDMLRDGVAMEDWTKFDLSSLGEVLTVKFNISGTPSNSWGFSVPAYFAYDNVTVCM